MMSKRRRTSSVASRGQDDDPESSDTTPEPTRKRKKVDPMDLCQQLYDVIRNHKKEDGTLLCDSFIRVRKRRQEPEYYEVVSNPIDLMRIQQKLKTDEYDDIEEMTADVQLMVNNAKIFYKRTSPEHRDACELWELFLSTKNKMLDSIDDEPKGKIILKVGKLARRAAAAEARRHEEMAEDTSESSTNDDEISNPYEDLFTTVMLATDLDNRPLHTVFQLLPSKKRYPEYYEVIENPIDLKRIATKIQENKYLAVNEMEKDLLQMTRNACLFNEPGSQIYKDAKALKKVITGKRIDVVTPGKTSERIRNKRMRGVQSLSAITAALQDDEEESDEGEGGDEEEDLEDSDNPRWLLYEVIKTATNTQGYLLSEPFWKLPSRRNYPDYYKEIRNPLSLFQIRNKLRRGDYGTVSEVAGDLNIMFENAKKYNRQDSQLYKDAVKLQKIMQTKVQELLDFDQDSESDADSDDKSVKRKGRGRPPLSAKTPSPPLKKRLHSICKSLLEYTREDGRQPILMFMEKPSKKLYPDYFQVIAEPIDVLTIEANIKSEKYSSEDEMFADFKLMFDNCRQYNEEGSLIYDDANTLEEFLKAKLASNSDSAKKPIKRSLPKEIYRNSSPKPKKSPATSVLSQKLKTLYDTIRDHKDPKGRQLSLIFLKLPSKSEYPDYYEVIKRPIDLERISHKLKASQYESLEDMVSDIVLMFDNACKYNEPDSQIYKDALMLQRVALQTKLQMRESDESVPDVASAVQELITSLFICVYNHQDEEGRCFSDSMAELPEHDEQQGQKVRALSLDLIKRRLDRNLYRRLDAFQDDMFTCLERARRLSRTDSQVFEDSIELQSFFIRQRDDLCRGGDLLHSPALSYTLLHLAGNVEEMRQSKLTGELPEEDAETRSSEDSMPIKQEVNATVAGETLSYNQQVYRVGDFVYIIPKERGMDASIVMVERLWTNIEGQQMMYGNFFYRPNETYHVTTRKFLEKEVFKSDQHLAVPLDQVQGMCYVVFVKDYFRYRPADIPEKDVYVCESRYSTKARAFKKIKVWPSSEREPGLVPREEPLELRRVMSVFRERVEKHKEEIAELEEQEKIVDKEKPNVEMLNPMGMEGCTYYEQFVTDNIGPIRTGDCVFVRTDSGRQLIAQVDSIWTNKQGLCYFQGPWLVTPPEIPHAPTRLFYKQEVFLSTLDDTNTVNSIVGKCSVLEHGEYISCRPTEIPETDVFVCEAIYDEARRQVRPLPREGLKKYAHSHAVFEDEIYFFRRLINPPKIGSESAQLHGDSSMAPPHYDLLQEAVAMIPRGIDEPDILTEDSLDGGPPSVGSGDVLPTVSLSTPVTTKKVQGLLKKNKKDGKKIVTGYILYSSDVRRNISANHPESGFGEISRMVGNEWRNLPAHEKQMWEERAAKVNEETTAKHAELGRDACSSPAPAPITVTPEQSAHSKVFECLWDNCDWQFDEITDCLDHAVQEPKGHVHVHFAAILPQDAEYQCQWRGCSRLKKNAPPFPNVQRLARHVKEVHIQKSSGRIIFPNDRSRNYMTSRINNLTPAAKNINALAVGNSMARQTPSPLAHATGTPVNIRQPEPLFVSVPPRPQRLLHSDAYIKYIEGLQVDNKFISSWDKQLRASAENTTVPDPARLPEAWLGNGVGNHGTIVNALWTLRDFMMRDAFGINKVIKMTDY